MSVTPFYAGWARYNELLTTAIRGMPAEELALTAPVYDRSGTAHMPIWAIAAHVAGARVYWLSVVLNEPGIESAAAFVDPTSSEGWEDDLSTPRSAEEVASALATSWAIVEGCLERWTPAMLEESIPLETPRGVVTYTRQSILLRLITHDAYHAGEIALIQALHGRPQLDLWPPGVHAVQGTAP
jgi:uncharacterized damage-inducible protein DinB